MFKTKNDKVKFSYGKVSLFLVALVTVIAGLVLHEWWWKVGGMVILIAFVQAYFRYRTLD